MPEAQTTVTLEIDVRPYLRAIERAGRAMHRFSVAMMRPGQRILHRRRCHWCSPMANPRPLSIDGHAYRRRSRRRR